MPTTLEVITHEVLELPRDQRLQLAHYILLGRCPVRRGGRAGVGRRNMLAHASRSRRSRHPHSLGGSPRPHPRQAELMQITVLPEVEAEITDASLYYEGRANGLGGTFEREVHFVFTAISAAPEMPRVRPRGYRRAARFRSIFSTCLRRNGRGFSRGRTRSRFTVW